MTMRTRKLIGVFAGMIYLSVYVLVAMALGGALFMDVNKIVQLAYFIAAGILWLPGMMLLIRWMARPD